MNKLALVAAVFAGAGIATVAALPQAVEARYNRVLSPPPYSVSPRAAALHSSLTVVDLHSDTLLWGRNILTRSRRGHVDLPRLMAGNVGIQLFTVVTKVPRRLNGRYNGDGTDLVSELAIAEHWPPRTWRALLPRALYQAERLRTAAQDSHGQLVLIRTADDLDRCVRQRQQGGGPVGAILGLEGAHALEGAPRTLDTLYDAGFRVVGLVHFFDNDVAGSSSGMRQGGLTAKGRELVRRAEARHMLIDLAHASSATIEDVTATASHPVIVSHTGVRGTCDSRRNLSDRELRAVAKTGGVIGIGYWPAATCGKDAEAIARAIRHAVDIAGIDHVGLGSDFDGAVSQPFDATGVPKVTEALLNAGFNETDIGKIMGGNALRVLREVLPRSSVAASYPLNESCAR